MNDNQLYFFCREKNTISVWNNGKGIPVVMHKEENMHVPTMIFGHLLTSSNFDDEEEKVTGGRNGYGAKLCNVFSKKFTVETASRKERLAFKQVNIFFKQTLPWLTYSFREIQARVILIVIFYSFRFGRITCRNHLNQRSRIFPGTIIQE